MFFPIKLVWNLQMACGQKLAVIALFASGFVCIAFATIRVVQVGSKAGNDTSPNPTWLALWTIVESAIAICIGCCPAFAVLYHTTRAANVSYDTDGYIRQIHSQTEADRGRVNAIKMNTVTTGRSRTSRIGLYWDDTTDSQEKLAGDSKGIIVTITLQQNSSHPSDTATTFLNDELQSSFVASSPVSPSRTGRAS
jgi:hypothetical protein